MMRSLAFGLFVTVALGGPVVAQSLIPPANLYIVSNAHTDLIAAFPSIERCEAAAAAYKATILGSGVAVTLLYVPTQ